MHTNSFVCTVCRFAVGTPRSLAQPFATKERYGCGVPLAGIAGACPTAADRQLLRLYSKFGNRYPKATSNTIIKVKPTAKKIVPMWECSPSDISGTSSSTTTYSMAPAAKPST